MGLSSWGRIFRLPVLPFPCCYYRGYYCCLHQCISATDGKAYIMRVRRRHPCCYYRGYYCCLNQCISTMRVIPSAPGIPPVFIERQAQTIHKDIAAYLTNAPRLRATDWMGAVMQSCELRGSTANETTRKIDPYKSPKKLIEGIKPSMSQFQRMKMGDTVVVHTPVTRSHVYTSCNLFSSLLFSSLPQLGL